jgi:hypothetical protein
MEEAIQFAEWIAQNHFKLANVKAGICYWIFDEPEHTYYMTTEELYDTYKSVC